MSDLPTTEERRAAFAAWDAYKPAATASYMTVSPALAAAMRTSEDTFLDNPLAMLTFVDGWLAGFRAGRAALREELEQRQRDLEARMGPLTDAELEQVRADMANIPRDWRLLKTIDAHKVEGAAGTAQRALLQRWLTNHLPCVYGDAGCDLCLETRAALEENA